MELVNAGGTAPDVTCVLIFFNGAQFINNAIRSVVDQRGGVDWELVLVDDGSTDSSTVIARSWAERYPERIRYVDHPGHDNLGMSASRNAGVAVASGEHIGFLDCDDVWLPSALAHGLRVFAGHPVIDVVIGGTWRWYGWTGDAADVARDHLMSLPNSRRHTVVEPPRLLGEMYGEPGAWRIPAMCSMLVTRSAFLRVGGLDERFRGLYEDQVLYVKFAVHLRSVVDPRPMSLYRQHPASACQAAIDAGEWHRTIPSEPHMKFLEWMHAYVHNATASDPAILAIVERNIEHAAGEKIAGLPDTTRSGLRRHLPAPVRRAARRVRRLMSDEDDVPSVVGVWSEQFLAPELAHRVGSTLFVEGEAGGDPWIGSLPNGACAHAASTRDRAWMGPAAPTFDRIVVLPGATVGLTTQALVAALGRQLSPHGSAFALVPGPAWELLRPGACEIIELAQQTLPQHRCTVESFGNEATARAVKTGQAAVELGTQIDRHDLRVPVLFGVSITSRVDVGTIEPGQ